MDYKLSDIARITEGILYGPDITVDGVVADSRSTPVGRSPLFVALCGTSHDGHSFVAQLYNRGCRAFLVERDVDHGRFPEAGFVRVQSGIDALQSLAADYRGRFTGTVVAITGSNGKTIVKEWLAELMPSDYRLFRSPKSYNSQLGVPLSVLMMRGDEQAAVFEAGISEPGEMERLQKILRPQIGVITNIGPAHQQFFETRRQKLEEKLILFAGADKVIYNGNYPDIRDTVPGTWADAADFIQYTGMVPFSDRISRENAAAAVAIARALGVPAERITQRLPSLRPVALRMEVKEGLYDSLLIDDAYTADPASFALALDYLNSVAGERRKVVVLSDIINTGSRPQELYGRVASLARESGVDLFVGIGAEISRHKALFEIKSRFYKSAEEFISSVSSHDIRDGVILIKGNRNARLEAVSRALEVKTHTTVLEVDMDAMRQNLAYYRSTVGQKVKIMAMVKASGYGNGTHEVASMLQNEGVDYLAVAFADEGVELRKRGISLPVVVLNADPDSYDAMIAWSLEPELYNMVSLTEFCAALQRHGERDYPVHIKIDSGMHRLGFGMDDMDQLCEALGSSRGLIYPASIFSHLASSDQSACDPLTVRQLGIFESACAKIASCTDHSPLRHIANSAAALRFPQARLDMIRLGIGLYGLAAADGLRPVSRLISRIVQVKNIPAGESVGYGYEGAADTDRRVALVPVGYADGLDRRLGNGCWAFTAMGRTLPTVGRISMDSCAVDITGTDLKEGDRVVIFGDANGIDRMAEALGTIPYEIMTSISSRVKRIYVKE